MSGGVMEVAAMICAVVVLVGLVVSAICYRHINSWLVVLIATLSLGGLGWSIANAGRLLPMLVSFSLLAAALAQLARSRTLREHQPRN